MLLAFCNYNWIKHINEADIPTGGDSGNFAG
jgi:hypothetical protein